MCVLTLCFSQYVDTRKWSRSILVKGRISKRMFQENKARQIFQKTNISYPLIHTSGAKKCSFFGKFGVVCFLETPVLRFALLPYYRRIWIFIFFTKNLSLTWASAILIHCNQLTITRLITRLIVIRIAPFTEIIWIARY